MRREAYLTNEIILKTELEIAKGEDGVISDEEMEGIRKGAIDSIRFLTTIQPGANNVDAGSMNNKLGWDTEEEIDGVSQGRGGAYRRKGGGVKYAQGSSGIGGDGASSIVDTESNVTNMEESNVW